MEWSTTLFLGHPSDSGENHRSRFCLLQSSHASYWSASVPPVRSFLSCSHLVTSSSYDADGLADFCRSAGTRSLLGLWEVALNPWVKPDLYLSSWTRSLSASLPAKPGTASQPSLTRCLLPLMELEVNNPVWDQQIIFVAFLVI